MGSRSIDWSFAYGGSVPVAKVVDEAPDDSSLVCEANCKIEQVLKKSYAAIEELEKKKADYAEKMQKKVASIHKEAEERRAMVEARKGKKCSRQRKWLQSIAQLELFRRSLGALAVRNVRHNSAPS